MDRTPLFSVILTCRNSHEPFLREAIESVLSQSRPFELIAVDDCSTNETPRILASYGERIRRVRTPECLGTHWAAFEYGQRIARGEIVVGLDHDDRFSPGKLARLREIFGSDPSIIYVAHTTERIDSTGRVLGGQNFLSAPRDPDSSRQSDRMREEILSFGVFWNGSSFAIRKRLLAPPRLPGRRANLGPPDGVCAVLAALDTKGRLVFVPETLSAYRSHSNQWTRDDTVGGRLRHLESWFGNQRRKWNWIARFRVDHSQSREGGRARLVLLRRRHEMASLRGELALIGGLLVPLTLGGLTGRLPLRELPGTWLRGAAGFFLGTEWAHLAIRLRRSGLRHRLPRLLNPFQ